MRNATYVFHDGVFPPTNQRWHAADMLAKFAHLTLAELMKKHAAERVVGGRCFTFIEFIQANF